MRVAILQSNYLPWKGYFDIINDVDLFVFYDDVQYTRADWRNRNKIKPKTGSQWLSVPVLGGRDKLIFEVTFADQKWQEQHWRSLTSAYGRAAHFPTISDFLRPFYLERRWETLSEMNQQVIQAIAKDVLHSRTDFVDSRTFAATGAKQDRLLDILRKCGATTYVSGPAARDYIEESGFREAGIELVWKDYSGYPEYPQLSSPFEHSVSIVDLLFNVGPDAPHYIWGWRNG